MNRPSPASGNHWAPGCVVGLAVSGSLLAATPITACSPWTEPASWAGAGAAASRTIAITITSDLAVMGRTSEHGSAPEGPARCAPGASQRPEAQATLGAMKPPLPALV